MKYFIIQLTLKGVTMTISVIVPCYNEEESLPLFYAEMEKIKPRLRDNIEYIFVNDGS